MLRALLCVQAGRACKPDSSCLNLAASALWGLLGCPKMSRRHFSFLDIKNVQHTSVAGALDCLTLSCTSSPKLGVGPALREHDVHAGCTLLCGTAVW